MTIHVAEPASAVRLRLKNYITWSLNGVAERNAACYASVMTTDADDSRRAILAEVEKVRQESYVAGYRAGLADAKKKLDELGDAAVIAIGSAFVPRGLAGPGVPKNGTIPWHVLQAVSEQAGMTGSEIVEAVSKRGVETSEASIRTSLSRLAERDLIVSKHRKWFPAPAE
jgi:hypothetical protein